MFGSALGLGALLRQRYNFGQRCAAAFLFFFVFFCFYPTT
jgi:SNF family Na+-dependent transporter